MSTLRPGGCAGGCEGLVLDEFEAPGNLAGLHAGVDVEFAVEVFHMPFDGIDGDDEGFGDLRVAAPGDQQGEYTLFLRREGFEQ